MNIKQKAVIPFLPLENREGAGMKGFKIKRSPNGRKGYTLVEMIVVFALIGLIMTLAAMLLTMSFRISSKIKALSAGQVVAEMFLDEIQDEISKDRDTWITAESFPVCEGFSVEDIVFSTLENKDGLNIIKVELKLKNGSGTSLSASRCIRCYNIKD